MERQVQDRERGTLPGRIGSVLRRAEMACAIAVGMVACASAQTNGLSVTLSNGFESAPGPVLGKELAARPRFDLPIGGNFTLTGWYATSIRKDGTYIRTDSLRELGVSAMVHFKVLEAIGQGVYVSAGLQDWSYNPAERSGFFHNIPVAGGSLSIKGIVDARATLFRALWGGGADSLLGGIGQPGGGTAGLSRRLFKNNGRAVRLEASKELVLAGSDTSTALEIVPEIAWGYTNLIGSYSTGYSEAGAALVFRTKAIELRAFAREQRQYSGQRKLDEIGLDVILGP